MNFHRAYLFSLAISLPSTVCAVEFPIWGVPNPFTGANDYQFPEPVNVSAFTTSPGSTLTLRSMPSNGSGQIRLGPGTVLGQGSNVLIGVVNNASVINLAGGAFLEISDTETFYEGRSIHFANTKPPNATPQRAYIYMWGVHRFANLTFDPYISVYVSERTPSVVGPRSLSLIVDNDLFIPATSGISAYVGYGPGEAVVGGAPSQTAGAHVFPPLAITGLTSNLPYGNFLDPQNFGAGPSNGGNRGGGVIMINAGRLTLSGSISAAAGMMTYGSGYYGGAGGSISIRCGQLRRADINTGALYVKGAQPVPDTVVLPNNDTNAGSGGRIALYCDRYDSSNSVITDLGGPGVYGVGTFYIKAANEAYGRFYPKNEYGGPRIPLFYGPFNALAGSNQPICPERFTIPQSAIDQQRFYVAGDPSVFDADRDGLYTWQELANGLDPNDADSNHDGIPDLDALRMGITGTNLDVDGDGVSNADEVRNGTNPYKADSDGDGVSDLLDYAPLDRTRSTLPAVVGDVTPPVITVDAPTVTIIN